MTGCLRPAVRHAERRSGASGLQAKGPIVGLANLRAHPDPPSNRRRLLAAAVEVFRTGGPEASLEAVARRAGVGIGTLYRHFPTRQALFEAVYRREVEDLARLAEALAGGAGGDPLDALRRWLHEGVGLVATKRGMLTALALAVDKSSDVYAFSYAHLTGAIGLLLAEAARAGRIRGDVTAEDVLHALVGLSTMGSEPRWEESVKRLLDIFVDGLRADAGSASSATDPR